jgi:hypothetical protein
MCETIFKKKISYMFFLTAVVREGHCIQNELAYVILIQPTELHSVLSNFLEQCPP